MEQWSDPLLREQRLVSALGLKVFWRQGRGVLHGFVLQSLFG
jgi:hypothetical protein